jgi:hypothetical protein
MCITPRIKQLYLSEETTKHIWWHKEGKCDSGDSDIMSHPTDGEAWQALNCFDPKFARDPRNVPLGLSMDGFQLHNTDSSPYSCWPVFVMPYNLLPNKCLTQMFIFLALFILGPKEPKKQMNTFFRPFMEELKEWQGDTSSVIVAATVFL